MTSPAAAPATPPRRSEFVNALASLLHAGNFIEAAEMTERSLLDAGTTLAVHALPAPLQAAAAPLAQVAEDAAMEMSDDAFKGQPVDESSLEQRIAGAAATAVASELGNALAPLNSVLGALLKKLG